jgi:hypothetical protein
MADRPLPALRTAVPPASIERELETAARYAEAALAPATRRCYERDWRVFADSCVARALRPMPAAPEAVAAFLAADPRQNAAARLARLPVATSTEAGYLPETEVV